MSNSNRYNELYRKHFNNLNKKSRIINPISSPEKVPNKDKNISYKFRCHFCLLENTAHYPLLEGHVLRCPRCLKLHLLNKVTQSELNPFDFNVDGMIISEEKFGEMLKSGTHKINPARFKSLH